MAKGKGKGRAPIDGVRRVRRLHFRETEANMRRLEAVAREGESAAQVARRLARQMLDILEGLG